MLKLLRWLRHPTPPSKADETTQMIDDALESSARQFRAIEPETDKQWRRVKIALERKRGASETHSLAVRKSLLKPALSFAVAAAILIVIGVMWLSNPSINIYKTAKGQHSTITLADSTEVTLNHTSELTVNRQPLEKARRVELKGEAFFRVRRNGMPFIITTDVGTVQVLGTEFNVRVRDDRMEVAVLSGSVKVSVNKNGIDSCAVLSKDQIAVCAKGDFPGTPRSIPFTGYPGWMHGKFTFYRTSLLSACKEIESQFDIVIGIKKAQPSDETITGTIDGQSVDAALATLARLTGNTYRHEGSRYVIY